ncbi:MAG: hypothetical protein JEZ07_07835 [Phycisphaerae bacterium]|nr:hypothetical protein [Phycisphaerae bacterium]
MTPREKFIMALEGKQPPGLVPHFELVFYLTMEAFGKVHPLHRVFQQWQQMTEHERELQRNDVAETYVMTARHYNHSAIFYHGPDYKTDKPELENAKAFEKIRELSGMDYFTMMHGDATYAIPNGSEMMEFVENIADKPQEMKDHAKRTVEDTLEAALGMKKYGTLDGFALCCDYCFNNGPFLSPKMFDEFVTPYLAELIAGYREMGYYVIKHTDGNIMPILDSLVSANPHALHSIDPQGKVDIAEVKKRVGDKVCLIGNVNCGLLDTGTDQQVIESAQYALEHGMPGGGYIFSTSNCVYSGMNLERYELMHKFWQEHGHYA